MSLDRFDYRKNMKWMVLYFEDKASLVEIVQGKINTQGKTKEKRRKARFE